MECIFISQFLLLGKQIDEGRCRGCGFLPSRFLTPPPHFPYLHHTPTHFPTPSHTLRHSFHIPPYLTQIPELPKIPHSHTTHTPPHSPNFFILPYTARFLSYTPPSYSPIFTYIEVIHGLIDVNQLVLYLLISFVLLVDSEIIKKN